MKSSSPSDVLIEVRNVHLDYPVRLYHGHGLRETFISALKHPVNFIMDSPEILPVLKGVNLTLRRGDRLGLLGINGAGKSSLCRVLCGMIRPPIGEVVVNGNVEGIFEVATGVMPELTGRENAYLLARIFYRTRHVPREQVEEALEFSELGSFLDMPFKTYSKGMQARLMLSLISASPSQVLILDEVFDGADVFFKEKIARRMMKKIEGSDAVIFVSHEPAQLQQLCNRVLVLGAGLVAFDGGVQEGLEHYLKHTSSTFGHAVN